MARYTPDATIKKLGDTRYMPLFNFADAEVCKHVIKASYKAGMRVFELTNRDTMALEVFRQLVPFVEKECPEMSFGAGTILDEETADHFMDAGADFIVAPIFDKGTAKACKKRNVPYIPGCMTPTEMYKAYKGGSAVIKLFPGGTVGPDYVKQVLAPLPFLKIVVTGGVQFDEASVRKWFDSGAFALGVGSSVFTKDRITKKDFISVEAELHRVKEY
jgi:2-dehydro-3-deoxyphosphogluconate aldolase / (4S)-4-hydroxy-2-oxoglutarate aldolase